MICSRTFIIIIIPIVLILQACNWPNDTGGDREVPPQTRIIEVLKKPVNIAPGDTASFTCIIEDSLNSRFKFYWVVEEGKVEQAEIVDTENSVYRSEHNTIQWIAPNENGVIYFQVTANNGSRDSIGVRQGFSINVEE